jgi:hypothetical protein
MCCWVKKGSQTVDLKAAGSSARHNIDAISSIILASGTREKLSISCKESLALSTIDPLDLFYPFKIFKLH